MTIDELITFCALSGKLTRHEVFEKYPDLHIFQATIRNKSLSLQYYQCPKTGKQNFIYGRVSTKDPKLGVHSTELDCFEDLDDVLS